MSPASDELDRLAHRVLMASFAGRTVPGWLSHRLASGLGSVCLFGSNVGSGPDARLAALTAAVHRDRPECLVAVDEEGGDVTRLDASTGSLVPGPAALGAVDEPELTLAVSAGLGRRLAAAGIDLDLAPDADVNSTPDNPVIGVRSFGADPALVGRHVAAFVRGLQSGGVAACAKHFPGHGDTDVDSHLDLPTVQVGRAVLASRELVPFAAAVAAGVAAIMTSHVLLPVLDPHRPATTSRRVLWLLRQDLGFDGVIVTDALDMAGISGPGACGSVPAAAVAALAAGTDLLCLGPNGGDAVLRGTAAAIRAAVADGVLDAEQLARSADRVDRLAAWVRESRRAAAASRPAGGAEALDVAATELGREVAARAIQVEGPLPDLTGALVVRLRTTAGYAAGEVPWGVGPALARRLPDVTALDLEEGSAEGGTLPGPADRPLLAVVRDAHRHPWVLRWLRRVAERRPDLAVVEMGWPAPAPLPGRCRVWTFGASRAAGEAAADLLAGRVRTGGSGR